MKVNKNLSRSDVDWGTPRTKSKVRRDFWHEVIFKSLYILFVGLWFGFTAAYCVKSVGDCAYKKAECNK